MARGQFALAVHTLVLLARAPDAATSLSLAGSVHTHATCLRRMLSTLAQAGLVTAAEGRDGGYRLALPASEITLADIYAALAGEPLLRARTPQADTGCPISAAMGPLVTEIAAEAEARFQEALARRTLADVTYQIDTLAQWIR
jgi:Rrf2 family transcriptional repressor of oqxAB